MIKSLLESVIEKVDRQKTKITHDTPNNTKM